MDLTQFPVLNQIKPHMPLLVVLTHHVRCVSELRTSSPPNRQTLIYHDARVALASAARVALSSAARVALPSASANWVLSVPLQSGSFKCLCEGALSSASAKWLFQVHLQNCSFKCRSSGSFKCLSNGLIQVLLEWLCQVPLEWLCQVQLQEYFQCFCKNICIFPASLQK